MTSHAEGQVRGSKLLGMPRPLAGALIGVFLFLLIIAVPKLLPSGSITLILNILSYAFEVWGRLVIALISGLVEIDPPESLANAVAILISMLPTAFLGWLIGSTRKSTQRIGIVLLVVYLLLTVVVGSLLVLMAI